MLIQIAKLIRDSAKQNNLENSIQTNRDLIYNNKQ